MTMNMQDDNWGNDAFLETLYYFKIIYSQAWAIVEQVYTYRGHPLSERLNKYYEPFLDYLQQTASLENFYVFQDIVAVLPRNLSIDTITEWTSKNHKPRTEGDRGTAQIEKMFQEYGAKEFLLPQWMDESLSIINAWLDYEDYPDIPVFMNNLSQLEEKVKKINESVQVKIVIETDGTVTYVSLRGKTYHGKIGKDTNEYNLLKCMASNVGSIVPYSELEKHLKTPREGAINDPKQRINHTITGIRNKLKLSLDDDIFFVKNGYGLKYPLIIKPDF